ncbi:MAG: DUF2891 family protein [Hyphomonadaceae bacterium]|nr:DUF2891 family protein [Hyphomonadaceae bacterium]
MLAAVCVLAACTSEMKEAPTPVAHEAAAAPVVQAPTFESLKAQRNEMAQALAAQASMCAARFDAAHPVFHGCYDWHSAVHGVWTLAAYEKRTGDTRHRAQLDALLAPSDLAAELADIRARPEFEMPYGRAWFLRLAAEWRGLGGDARLDPLAREIVRSFRAAYAKTAPTPFMEEYANDSWALINILHYARATNDRPLQAYVVQQVRAHFIGADQRCDLAVEQRGFLSVCATWAWLVAEALPREEFRAWYARWNPGLETLTPVTSFNNAHDYGRNFSRAWGLHQLAEATGDQRLAASYAAHVAAGYTPASQWNGDYDRVGHWVAQFGTLAIGPLFDAPPADQ